MHSLLAPPPASHLALFTWYLIFARALTAFEARLMPDLTSPARFHYIKNIEVLLQTGSSGLVPVPPEKRFILNLNHAPKFVTSISASLIGALCRRGFYDLASRFGRLTHFEDDELLYQLADASFQMGRLDDCIRYCDLIRSQERYLEKARLLKAWIRFQRGHVDEGWPPYPGVGSFKAGKRRDISPSEASQDKQPILVKKANRPGELEEALGLQPWAPGVETGKRVLLWFNFNNSLGGEILCSRLVSAFQEKYATPLLMAVDARLKRLFEATFCESLMVSKSDDLRAIAASCDYYILGRDLLKYTISSLNDFRDVSASCMRIPEGLAQPSLESGDGRKMIALTWKTTNVDQGRYRNIPLEPLAKLLARHPFHYYSAQHGDLTADKAILQQHLGNRIVFGAVDPRAEMHMLASWLKSMLALVTIDNSLLHLAGAVGVPTYALISIPSYWAWPLEGDDCRWYKSVRFLRQRKPRVWKDVLEQLDQVLLALRHDQACVAASARVIACPSVSTCTQ